MDEDLEKEDLNQIFILKSNYNNLSLMYYKLKNFLFTMLSPLMKFLKKVFYVFIDKNTMNGLYLKNSVFSQLVFTLRYNFASKLFPLTKNEARIKKLKNIHKGKRAFLIGNGPSLNKMDLTLLKDEITFGVNSIFLNYEKMGFHPKYYIVEDILVAEDRGNEINKYKGPELKFFGNYLGRFLKPAKDILWLNVLVRYDKYAGFPYFSKDVLRALWTGGSVTYLGMQLAYYMGIEELYLIGFDHNYVIPDSIEKKGHKFTSTEDDPNHFHPDYFGKGYRWHDPIVERMEQGYLKAKENFEKDNRKLLNATAGGKLETLERVNFEDLFKSQ